jgi:hypothetical protein
VDEGAVAQVVQATVLEDLGTCLEPHGLAEWHAVLGQQLRGDAAQSAWGQQQQATAAMLQMLRHLWLLAAMACKCLLQYSS